MTKVILEDGKYTFYVTDSFIPKCDRYDEPWREFLGDKAIYCLITHTIEQQKQIEQLQAELAELKPQAMLLRRFLNNANAEVERLAEENRRLKVANGKLKDEV